MTAGSQAVTNAQFSGVIDSAGPRIPDHEPRLPPNTGVRIRVIKGRVRVLGYHRVRYRVSPAMVMGPLCRPTRHVAHYPEWHAKRRPSQQLRTRHPARLQRRMDLHNQRPTKPRVSPDAEEGVDPFGSTPSHHRLGYDLLSK